MTDLSKDEVIAIAREAGICIRHPDECDLTTYGEITRFATLARAPLVAANALQHETLDKLHQALARAEAAEAELASMKAGEPVAMPSGEQKCYCGDHVSLQMVSGGGAPEGYLGKVTLRIGDQYRDYYTYPQPSAVPVVQTLVEALETALDQTDQIGRQGDWNALSSAIAKGQQFVKEQS